MTKEIDVDPTTVETVAAVQGIIMGKELGAQGIIFEGDAKQLIQAVNSLAPCNSNYGHLVEDIQCELMAFSNSSFNFIFRDGNFAADGLTKEAIRHVVDKTWRYEIPPCVYDIIKGEEILPPL